MRQTQRALQLAVLVGFSTLVAACGGADEDSTPTLLAREVNYVACEESRSALARIDLALAGAGVRVYSSGCASDGAVFAAVCGIDVYYLRWVEVPKAQEQLARSLNFRAPGEFRSFVPVSCPSQ